MKKVLFFAAILMLFMPSCKSKNEPKAEPDVDLFPIPVLEWGISYDNLRTGMENKGYVWESRSEEVGDDFVAWFVYGNHQEIEFCARTNDGFYDECVLNVKQNVYSYSQVHELLASHFSFVRNEKLMKWELHDETFSNSTTTVNYCEWKDSEENQHVINFWKTR